MRNTQIRFYSLLFVVAITAIGCENKISSKPLFSTNAELTSPSNSPADGSTVGISADGSLSGPELECDETCEINAEIDAAAEL